MDHPINEKLVKVAYTEDDTIVTDGFAIVYRIKKIKGRVSQMEII